MYANNTSDKFGTLTLLIEGVSGVGHVLVSESVSYLWSNLEIYKFACKYSHIFDGLIY